MSIDAVNGSRDSRAACHSIGEPITSTVLTLFLLPAVCVALRGQEAQRGNRSAEDESTAQAAERLQAAEVSPMAPARVKNIVKPPRAGPRRAT
jgi:hypothetical protein